METNKTTVYIILGVIVVLLLFGIYNNYQKTHPDTKNDKSSSNKTVSNGNSKTSIFKSIWLYIVLIPIGMLSVYLFMKKDTIFAVKSMSSDDQEDIILKERLVKKQGYPGYYDENGELQIPNGMVNVIDKRLHCDRMSGAEFMMYDAEILNTLYFMTTNGINTYNVQLNRDKKEIQGGSYSMFRNTNQMQFIQDKFYGKKLPQAHPMSEDMRLIAVASQEDVDIGQINNLRRQTQPNPQSNDGYMTQPDYLYGQDEHDEDTPMSQDNYRQPPIIKKQRPWYKKWRK